MTPQEGGAHNFDAHVRCDAQRDRRLAREGFRVLRFWNNEIDRNLEGVLTIIERCVSPTRPRFACATLPRKDAGEGWS